MNTRFWVEYHLTGSTKEAEDIAKGIAIEQSFGLPLQLVASGFLQDEILGRVEDFKVLNDQTSYAKISYLTESIGNELTQLMNVLYGNISLWKGIKVIGLELPDPLKAYFAGPRFGISGLRDRLRAPVGPLLMAQVKPMGRGTHELAELAYRFAIGGVDLIIEDHMITDQTWSHFRDRVFAISQAVQRANSKTKGNCVYVPNVTSSPEELLLRADWASRYGAGALLVSPGLTGLDSLQRLSQNRRPGLPIIAHPTFLGSLMLSPNQGIVPGLLLGTIFRLAGADCSLLPYAGGRFGFHEEDCQSVIQNCQQADSLLKCSMPALGGGITLENLPSLYKKYGDDVIYLLGGQLYGMSADLPENVRQLRRILERET